MLVKVLKGEGVMVSLRSCERVERIINKSASFGKRLLLGDDAKITESVRIVGRPVVDWGIHEYFLIFIKFSVIRLERHDSIFSLLFVECDL